MAEKPAWVERVWARVREEVAGGHQVYVVCPRVGGDAGSDAELVEPDDPDADEGPSAAPPCAVLDVAPQLVEGALDGLRIGVLHGRLPPEEKDDVMRAFARGELDVLVATTVIEVGVDVPNATGMVIMDADRFGLSQLHQLRGRVGRGAAPGVCLLVTDVPPGTTARERLDAVAGTTDGFELARLDLELRREGDVLGAVQSGRRSGLRLLCLLRHEEIIAQAQRYATELVAADPGLAATPGWPSWSTRPSATTSAPPTWTRSDPRRSRVRRGGCRGRRRPARPARCAAGGSRRSGRAWPARSGPGRRRPAAPDRCRSPGPW